MIVEYIEDHSVKYQDKVWKAPRPSSGVLPQFARYLLSCGVPSDECLNATSEGTLVWESGITLKRWASISVQDNDMGFRLKKYVPFEKWER